MLMIKRAAWPKWKRDLIRDVLEVLEVIVDDPYFRARRLRRRQKRQRANIKRK